MLGGSFIGFLFIKALQNNRFHSISLTGITFVFLKIGTILFGSGYVLIAYLIDEFVNQRQWLSIQQVTDAIAVGQLTPGPVLTTSTFIGYSLHGFSGALLSTIAMFLPSFLFVYLLNPIIPKLRSSHNISIFLNCLNAAAIGLMLAALIPLSTSTFTHPVSVIIFLGSGILFLKAPHISSTVYIVTSILMSSIFFHFWG